MASSFVGGFAGTLRDIRLDDRKREKDLEQADALERLKKKYEAEIVDNQQTTIEGTAEVRRNKFGDEISRRELSPDELSLRKAELDKSSNEARRTGAMADVATLESKYYEADRQFDMDDKRRARALDEERTSISRGHLGVAQDEAKRRAEEGKEAKADQVISMLFEAGELGDASAMSLAEQYQMELDEAITEGERQRVISRALGQARNRLMQAKHNNAMELRKTKAGGGVSLDDVTLPGT